MRTFASLLAAALGLSACARTPATPAVARAAAPAAVAAVPADPAAALPGISLEGLSPEQQRILAELSATEFCYCGCPHTVGACLREHGGCKHAGRMLWLAARILRAGAGRAETVKLLTDYYASFDRRQRLDVGAFGPPLGNPDAPLTMVEFSDFKCPYCQVLRPTLEKFVTERGDRVKLYYKPFPIESHPGALEAAQAAEWARDQGIFWPMHDALFSDPHANTVDELAGAARALGADAGSLREALDSRRYEAKIRGSQAEGRAAGMHGTPTLFLGGRLVALPDHSEETLEFALEDEEDWQKQKGFGRD